MGSKKLDMIQRKKWILPFTLILVSAIGLWARFQGIYFESGDYRSCLSIWTEELSGGKGLRALADYNGDYNMPYITVLLLLTYLPFEPIICIKSVSILFDFVCAFAGAALAVICAKNAKRRELIFGIAYSLIFLSPIAVLNSGWWGQCDSIYVGFIILSAVCLLKEKPSLCMIFMGCALAFKLQTVFALPMLMIYYWKNKNFSVWKFFLIPITMEILCLPAIIGGCSPWVTFSVYFSQMKTFPEMFYYYPNFWTFFQNAPYYVFGRMAVAGTFALLLTEAVLILQKETVINKKNYLPLFCLLVMTTLCFLPSMHDRYGYMLEMTAMIYAAADKRKWWFALMLQMTTFTVYLPAFLRRYVIDARIVAAVYLLTFAAFAYCEIKRLTKREGENVHA